MIEDQQKPTPTDTSFTPAGQTSQLPGGSPQPLAHKTSRKKPKSSILSTLLLFLLAPLIAIGVTTFMFQSYEVDGDSMETTLQHTNRLIVDKIPRSWSRVTGNPYIPARGQIIIFNQSGILNFVGDQDRQLIKRVVGLPGERVVVKNGTITVYNRIYPEGFNPDTTGDYIIESSKTPGDVDFSLKPDQVFVAGDNRLNSADSREFGPIDASQVVGRLSIRILPLDKAQRF